MPLFFVACSTAGLPAFSQDARIAPSSIVIEPLKGEKKINVSVRLVDDPAITVVTAATKGTGSSVEVPVMWKSYAGTPDSKCEWLLVIDNSNPSRGQSVAACVAEAKRFLSELPSGDSVMISSIARDLVVLAPFDAKREAKEEALSAIKAGGEGTQATLIYQNLRLALIQHLAKRPESRKAVVLFTDGKDETSGGPDAIRTQVKELIATSKETGVVIHTLGFAERASEANFFADLKEVSFETEGLHVAAEVSSRRLPDQTWQRVIGVMHGGGTAVVDLAKIEEAVPIEVTFQTASGRKAMVVIDKEPVSVALEPVPQVLPEEPAKPEPEAQPEPESEEPAKAEPEPEQEPQPETEESDPEAEPEDEKQNSLLWLIAGGVALFIAILAIVISRKKAAAAARRAQALRDAEQARFAQEKIEAEDAQDEQTRVSPSPALAILEMCDSDQTRFPIEVTNLKIGRGQHNDFVLRNDSVSGNHCVIQRNRQAEWSITDLESGNGIVLNGKSVEKSILVHGDVIELGELKMRFLLS